MILDTNFIIDILRNNKDAINKLKQLKNRKEPIIIPPGVLYELYSGAESEKEVKRIENELKRIQLTPTIEKEAARIRKKLTQEGNPISSVDYLIAGTARHKNEKILTNDQHFQKIKEINTEPF